MSSVTNGDSLPLLPKGHWALYKGALCKAGNFSSPVVSLFSNDSKTEQLGFQKIDNDEAWLLRVDRDALDRLFRVSTVCEWRAALWSVMSLPPSGKVFLSWIQGSAQFEELREKPGVEELDRGLVGEPEFSEVSNVQSWREDFDVNTGERSGVGAIPDVAELCKEFKRRQSK